MFKNNIFPISVILLVIALFYSWTVTFQGDFWLISLGVNMLQILVGVFSLVWLFLAYRNAEHRQKSFWRLLLIGLAVHVSSNWLWLYFQISQGAVISTNLSHFIWMVAYLFFLAALISKTRELSSGFSGHSFIFNITVFMVTVGAVSFHYLIQPILRVSGESGMATLATVIYPVADLTILFVLTILYYLIQKNKQQEILLLCITGFSIQIAADFIFVYLSFNDAYFTGHSVDLVWLVSTLFIGFSAYYAKRGTGSTAWLVKNPIRDKAVVFPYISILTLFVLVIHSNQWDFNALTAGLSAAFLLVLGNQMQVLRKNQQLVEQYGIWLTMIR